MLLSAAMLNAVLAGKVSYWNNLELEIDDSDQSMTYLYIATYKSV